jgi:hypothetical protein
MAGDAQIVSSLLEAGSIVSVSDEQEECIDPSLAQSDEHRHEIVGALHRRHPAEPPDDEAICADPVTTPELNRVAVIRDPRFELDSKSDYLELAERRNPEAHKLVADLGAHGHQAIRDARKDRFDCAKYE